MRSFLGKRKIPGLPGGLVPPTHRRVGHGARFPALTSPIRPHRKIGSRHPSVFRLLSLRDAECHVAMLSLQRTLLHQVGFSWFPSAAVTNTTTLGT